MTSVTADLSWLENPEVFRVNRLDAHSDHRYYESVKEMEEENMKLRQSLNGTWRFSFAKAPAYRRQDFYKEEYDCSAFERIEVPGHIELQGYGKCQYINTMYPWDGRSELRPPHVDWEDNPVGSYVREFDLEGPLLGKKTYLSFQGVESACYVWLNGHFVGYAEDSFTPSEFEVTEYVREKGNKLAVEVYKRSSASWIEDQDFFRFSGIFRDVYVYAVPLCHVRDLFVKASLDDSYETGVFEAEVSAEGEPCSAFAVLKDKDGNEVWSQSCEAGPGFSFGGTISGVHSWSGENPYLYTLTITLTDRQGSEREYVSQKVGFRRFVMKDGIMCLNGKRIVFRGINRHEFNVKRGRAVTEEDMMWDVRFMKRHNINAVRTCHYPNQSRWYELCDEYGIYLIDEANLESHGSWQKMGRCDPSWNVPGSLPEWKNCVLDRASSMVERDKNHPSVLIWSCGNESYAGEGILAMSDYFREKDPSRLVHYEGVFWNRDFDRTSDMESRMYAKPKEVEAYLEKDPEKPFILCEYMHAMGNSLGGMKCYTDLEDRYLKYQGGFIWDYIDQAIMKKDEDGIWHMAYGGDFTDRPTDYNFCGNGIVYADRTVSPKAQEVKYLYQDIRLTPDEKGVLIENRKLFSDTSNYEFIYTVLKDGNKVYTYRFEASVLPSESAYIQVPSPESAEEGEYVYQTAAVLKKAEPYGEAGFETAFGESRKVEGGFLQRPEPVPGAEPLKVVRGDVNIGVKGNGFHIIFSIQEGGIVSLVYRGKEWVVKPPVPAVWRASTDNDRGNKFPVESAVWMGAGYFPGYDKTSCTVETDGGKVKVGYTYRFSTVPLSEAVVTYEVENDGSILVRIGYHGAQGLPQLPCFGMRFLVPGRISNFSWYGRGPEENYCDRMEGARLGIFTDTPENSLAKYLIPQECGNRMDVRSLLMKDCEGRELRFRAVDRPFDMSVLPYTAYELESAAHMEELPSYRNTSVNIFGATRGVGGDDSWGAPVHPEYCISGENGIEYAFVISG